MTLFEPFKEFILHIGNVLNNITQGSTWGKIMIGLGATATAYITPILGLLITCFVLTLVDMGYGIAVAKKLKKKITSDRNWSGTLSKLFHEFTLLGMARLIEFTVLGSEGVFVFTGGITIVIALTELWSIIENLNTLNPKGPWKMLGAFLKKKGEDYVGIELDLDKNEDDDTCVADLPQEDRR